MGCQGGVMCIGSAGIYFGAKYFVLRCGFFVMDSYG